MVRVGILGGTGYTALELIRILLRHPDAEITAVTSRQEGSPHLGSVHPSLVGRINLQLENLGPAEVASRTDCIFSCLPHGVVTHWVPSLLAAGRKIIDFSADYRLADAATYETWYGEKHGDPDRLGRVVYGLPELFREEIQRSDLVANPGCYPTSAILPLTPLIKVGLIEASDVIIDSKSGVSGAGRTLKMTTHYPECNESISAYNVGRHRHTPEIELITSRGAGQDVRVLFTPHLVPMDRGILSTIYVRPKGDVSEQQALTALREFYSDEPFIRIVEHLPATKDTIGSNYVDITVRRVRDRLILICCEDNLIKGASGAAVQNFNLMYGFAETTAL
jgi:N-acetyl-gamma-glutamyl-phosphate reductase